MRDVATNSKCNSPGEALLQQVQCCIHSVKRQSCLFSGLEAITFLCSQAYVGSNLQLTCHALEFMLVHNPTALSCVQLSRLRAMRQGSNKQIQGDQQTRHAENHDGRKPASYPNKLSRLLLHPSTRSCDLHCGHTVHNAHDRGVNACTGV